jgi:hypothetical protein
MSMAQKGGKYKIKMKDSFIEEKSYFCKVSMKANR